MFRIFKNGVVIGSMVLLSCVIQNAFGDCLACFSLKGVRIESKDGIKYNGYVIWHPIWERLSPPPGGYKSELDIKFEDKGKFPDQIRGWKKGEITLYTKLFSVTKPLENKSVFLVTDNSGLINLSVNKIKKIQPDSSMKHNGYQGAGTIPIHSTRAIKMLTEETPIAIISEDQSVFDRILISYDPQIKEKDLKDKLNTVNNCCSTKEEWIELINKLEEEKIVILDISYD